MKKITKVASIAMAAVMLLSAVPMTASAASAKAVDSENVAKGIKLSWSKTSKANKYTVYRSTSKNKGFKYVGTTKKVTFTDKKAKSGKTYYYKIKASTGSTYKVEKAVRLTAPKLKSVKANKNDIVTLKWTSVKGTKKYNIYRAKVVNGKTKKFSLYDTSKKTKYQDWFITTGSYKYKVEAVKGDSIGVASNVKTLNYVPATAPMVSPNDEHTLMNVYFSPVNDVDGYKIYRSVNGSDFKQVINFKAKNVPLVESGTYEGMGVYADSNVEYGSTYKYAIKTYKGKNTSVLIDSLVETEFTEADVIVEIGETSNDLADAVKLIQDILGGELMPEVEFSFTIDNPEIATIGEDYVVTGVSVGKTFAYMVMSNTIGDETITVTVPEPILIAVKEADVMLETSQTSDFLIQATDPELADNVTVTYEIEDTSIATVDENGIITAVAPGKTYAYYTVTSTDENGETASEKSEAFSIYVSAPATDDPEQPTDPSESTTPSEPSEPVTDPSVPDNSTETDPSTSATDPSEEPSTAPSEPATTPSETVTTPSESVTVPSETATIPSETVAIA